LFRLEQYSRFHATRSSPNSSSSTSSSITSPVATLTGSTSPTGVAAMAA